MQTPCDVPYEYIDSNGKQRKEYRCPYKDTYVGYESEMCRNCCGLGVDEDSYPEEEEDYEEF